MEITNSLIGEYIEELNRIREDKSLLEEFKFSINDPNHFGRLKLNIALFNDFNEADFWIAKYLFEQESNWRKSENYYDIGEVDNLYFSAFLVSRYQKPEMVIKFFETKMIDFDSGIGFDGEFLLSNGKEGTFNFLLESNDERVEDIYKHIGNSIENCRYRDEELKSWETFKYQYFRNYIQPIEDEMWFLYSVKEQNALRDNFEIWIDGQTELMGNNLSRYILYSEYLDDSNHLIIGLEKKLELENKSIDEEPWRYKKIILAYFKNGRPEDGLFYLAEILSVLDNKNRKRDYVDILCDFFLSREYPEYDKRVFDMITKEFNQHGSFLKRVDDKFDQILKLSE